MKTVYGQAPVYCVDGVPGYKAGEWPGIKSNKFDNTRRIISQITQGVLFTENEIILPKVKLLGPGPSKEYVFRPCIKMVKPPRNKNDGNQVITSTKPEGYRSFDRKTICQVIEDYHSSVIDNERRKKASSLITKDFGLKHTGIFSQDFFDNINNNKILGVTLNKESFMNHSKTLKRKNDTNDFIKNSKIAWKHQEVKKIMSLRMEKENAKRDIDYVSSLNTWNYSK